MKGGCRGLLSCIVSWAVSGLQVYFGGELEGVVAPHLLTEERPSSLNLGRLHILAATALSAKVQLSYDQAATQD